MSNCDQSHTENQSETGDQVAFAKLEKPTVEVLTLKSPNALREKQNMSVPPENSKNDHQIKESLQIESSTGLSNFLEDYKKDMDKLKYSANGKAQSAMESGIVSDITDDDDKLYYFKYMVPPGKPSRQPLSDLLKDMLMQATNQTGIYASNMIRKEPYPRSISMFELAKDNLVNYINEKVGTDTRTEIWKPKLTGIFSHFGSKFNRVVIPKAASFMGSGFGKLLVKLLHK